MWTHSDVAVLLKAVQTAYLLQQEEFAGPRLVSGDLDRWERVVEDFIPEPGTERIGPSGPVCASSSPSSGRRRGGVTTEEGGNGAPDYVQRYSHRSLSDGAASDKNKGTRLPGGPFRDAAVAWYAAYEDFTDRVRRDDVLDPARRRDSQLLSEQQKRYRQGP